MKDPGALKAEIVKPIRKEIKPVQVHPCPPDGICPPGTSFFMDRENFSNLQENVINTESYLQQLENLLDTISKSPEE